MRTLLVSLTAISLLLVVAPATEARPECLQVYPWSELCQGDLEGFQEAVVDDDVCYQEPSHVTRCYDLTQTVGVRAGLPKPQCLQVYPWSELCEGDVGAFTCYFLQNVKCDILELA